ncbi:gliding motility lipoprotein GldB [Winogradskyella maritima]|uniref:Gliding motility lipoprotein GldB n=1 Tax=Winogradskyella maritima TaxID=1517766 RepID=A0ABV8AII4_9FLAO|nr:gliding motility lipoprotein GldB [Winogradskyella maritima]
MFSKIKYIKHLFVALALILVACDDESALEKEIEKIEIDINIERFDRIFANSNFDDLPKLKADYPFLFSKRIPDSIWTAKIQDSLQIELLNEVDKTFGNFEKQKAELKKFFQHLKFYNPDTEIPRIITLTNDVDYRNKTYLADSIALIALDNYLGSQHPFYVNFQRYITKGMTPEQITVDLATDYAEKAIYQPNRKTFLDEMIYFGKQLYYKDVMIPFKTDAEKINYSENNMEWAKVNESMIWTYFVENEVFYKNDNKLVSRFLADAPYSKFNLQLDNESPPRLGQYIGWQIVRAYADKTDADLQTLMQTDAEEIFNKSKYKPKK